MKLVFKATRNYKYHNDSNTGIVRDGDVVNVPNDVGKKLMADYPNNFFISRKRVIEDAKTTVIDERSDTILKDIVDETLVKPSLKKRSRKVGDKK